MHTPLVVIVVLNWNGREDTETCLASLGEVTYPRSRVLLVDNGSTDGSVEHLRPKFPDVEFIENGSNLGFAEGNNVGIRRALAMDAEWVLLLNNDTEVEPGFLSTLVEAAQSDGRIGIIGPQINRMPERKRISFAGGKISLWLGFTHHVGNHRRDRRQYAGVIDEDYQTGAAMMISRRAIEKVGMLDAGFVSYFEDADLCLRAKHAGLRVVCCRDALVYHRVSGSTGGGLTPFKVYRKIVAGGRFYRRHAGRARTLTTIAAFNVLYVGAVMTFSVLRGKFDVAAAAARGLADVARGRDRHRLTPKE